LKISDILGLGKTQHELDFVNVDIDHDTPLFLDPYFMSKRKDDWSIKASLTVNNFFQTVINNIREGDHATALDLLSYLGEPNETCLGLSKGQPSGRGIGSTQARDIFESLRRSKAVKTGLVEHLEDCHIFIANIAKDKVSDMTTNLIKKHLIGYTQNQCKLWGIPLIPNVPSGFFWSRESLSWENEYTDYLIINNKRVLLVPKAVVSYADSYTPQKYYQHFVLNFLKNEHLRLGTQLVKRKRKKSGEVVEKVFKKDVARESPLSKDFLVGFTKKHPKVFAKFKSTIASRQKSLSNEEISSEHIDTEDLCEHLIRELEGTLAGNASATYYHRLVLGILELLFYPFLMYPQIEQEIHSGRKRIDIVFDNAATEGFFHRLHQIDNIPCQYIFVECKNYDSDPSNPELDQISGRLAPNRGKFGIICCRKINDLDLFIKRCTDTYRDERGLIIPLTDSDLITALQEFASGETQHIFEILTAKKRKIVLH
jgi:hypothetical protein